MTTVTRGHVENVKAWANKYDLNVEVEILILNGFDDLPSVALITESDLDAIGITKIGTKKKIIAAASAIKKKIIKLAEIGGSLADIHKLANYMPIEISPPKETPKETPKEPEINLQALKGEDLIEYFEIRKAILIDIPQITAIYNYYVLNYPQLPGQEEEKSEQKFVTDFYGHDAKYPILVEVLTKPLAHYPVGFVLGYLSLYPFSGDTAAKHMAMASMYMHNEFKSKGIGLILTVLVGELCYKNGIQFLVDKVLSDNKSSISLAEKVGFCKVGVLKEAQIIKGKKYDLIMYQKDLVQDREKDYPSIKLILSSVHQNVVTIDK